ncbi:MAG: GNAT family N-acetyltransferase [Sphingobacteriales bacterium]|nr:MAG: GNAT family N-acetyltransferase [Sphingobacteriales bacterium]
MLYRLLTREESSEYRKIRLESLKLFPENFRANYDEMILKPKLLFEQFIEEENERCFVVGAFEFERLIGIISFSDTNEYKLLNTGTFIQMYIKPDYQGKGLGLALTKSALQKALAVKDIHSVVLEVKAPNLSATTTYQRAGFTILELPDKPNDFLVMTCSTA